MKPALHDPVADHCNRWRSRLLSICGVLLSVMMAMPAQAQTQTQALGEPIKEVDDAAGSKAYAPVREIAFRGNQKTLAKTMLREMSLHVGDPADPSAIARSRQQILDLGLFQSVESEESPLDDGLRVTFVVKEKVFLLPLPRVEANSDGEYGLGGNLRWNNVTGQNDTAQLLAVKRQLKERDRDSQLLINGSYVAPLLFDTPYTLSTAGGISEQHSLNPDGTGYNESFQGLEVIATRSLSPEMPPSQGWYAGGGPQFQNESVDGPFAPKPYGHATSAVGVVGYKDMRFHVFSEDGTLFSFRLESAINDLASDYGYVQAITSYEHIWPIGTTPFQTFGFKAQGSGYVGGGDNRRLNAYSIGGAARLRGYEKDLAEGDFSYYFSGEYLVPMWRPWLRFLAIAEAGSVYPKPGQTGGRPLYASIGFGVRARIPWLVGIELEAGVALPLIDDNQARPFAGIL
jgi:outer membrane protein assembly factor BamA